MCKIFTSYSCHKPIYNVSNTAYNLHYRKNHYVNKRNFFQCSWFLDLNRIVDSIGTPEFYEELPKLMENSSYGDDFYDFWDKEGAAAALLKFGEGLPSDKLECLRKIGEVIDSEGY